ncbi:hypothetical protein [Phocaeicola sp.]
MKTKTILGMLIAFFLAAGMASCSDNDEEEVKEVLPLIFEKTMYETSLIRIYNIPILSGNGSYSIKVENPEVLDADPFLHEGNEIGYIQLMSKRKGVTALTVTDNVSGETAKLTVTVTDGYMTFPVQRSNHPALDEHVWIYLINNDARECYFMQGDDRDEYATSTILFRGTYQFSAEKAREKSKYYLTLVYASDENGKFTDAAIAPMQHKFDISGSDSELFKIIPNYLPVNWGVPENASSDVKVAPRLDMPHVYTLNMKEVGTEYEVILTLSSRSIPEGVLK